MIPTFVFGWPGGHETGEYLALDLGVAPLHFSLFDQRDLTDHPGGTNLRVCLVTLKGGGKFEITQSKYRLNEEQKHDDGQKLFDFCAECVKIFINSNLGDSEEMMKSGVRLPLGFTVCPQGIVRRVMGLFFADRQIEIHSSLIHARLYPSFKPEGQHSEALTRFIQAREDRPWCPPSLDQGLQRAENGRTGRDGHVPEIHRSSRESLYAPHRANPTKIDNRTSPWTLLPSRAIPRER